MWALSDGQYVVVYPKSAVDPGDIAITSNSDGSQTVRMRMLVAFFPFNQSLEWDPNFYLLLSGEEPPYAREASAEPYVPGSPRAPDSGSSLAKTQDLVLYVVPPVVVAVLIVVVVGVIIKRRRYTTHVSRMRARVIQESSSTVHTPREGEETTPPSPRAGWTKSVTPTSTH